MAMEIALVVAVVVFGALAVLAIYPPQRPHWWRHHTRPLRRKVRPSHYR